MTPAERRRLARSATGSAGLDRRLRARGVSVRFSDPRPRGPPRRAAGLPRQRRHHPAAAAGDRRACRRLPGSTTPTSIAASTCWPKRSTSSTRPPGKRCGPSSTRPAARASDDSPATTEQIIFTSGTTHSINLVARSWGDANLRPATKSSLSRDGAPLEPRALVSSWPSEPARSCATFRSPTTVGSISTRSTGC